MEVGHDRIGKDKAVFLMQKLARSSVGFDGTGPDWMGQDRIGWDRAGLKGQDRIG